MHGDLEYEKRRRAFQIWEREGRSGDPIGHWLQAERELALEAQETHRRSSGENLPEHWVSAINSAVQKLTRKARIRVNRLRS